MRYLFVVILAGTVAGLYFTQNIPGVQRYIAVAGDSLREAFYNPVVHVEGATPIVEKRVRELLPRGRSLIWWNFSGSELLQKLVQESLIRSATLERCGFFRPACFRITVDERQPRLIAFVGPQAWLVDDHGSFIGPVQQESGAILKSQGVDGEKLPLLRGLVSEAGALDVVAGRVGHVVRALEVIEKEVEQKIETVFIRPSGELEVKLVPFGFTAVFDADTAEMATVQQEAVRLKRLLQEFSGREEALREIDLAFDRTAVVKLHEAS